MITLAAQGLSISFVMAKLGNVSKNIIKLGTTIVCAFVNSFVLGLEPPLRIDWYIGFLIFMIGFVLYQYMN